MIILRKQLITVSVYLLLIIPFFITCSSLHPALLIQGFALVLLILSFYFQDKKYKDIFIFCLLELFCYFIVYFSTENIQLIFLMIIYGAVLGRIGVYFILNRKGFNSHNMSLKIINIFWAGIVINYIVYPYVKLHFIDFKDYGTFHNVLFNNCKGFVIFLSISYLFIVILACLIDNKGIRTTKSVDPIIFYLYFIGIFMVFIPMIHLGMWMYF